MVRHFGRLFAALLVLAAPRAPAAALDSGDLLVPDWNNERVLRVNPVTHAVSVYSPRNAAQPDLLDGPSDIAIDDAGIAWVINYESGRLIRIDPATGMQREMQECPLFGVCSTLDLAQPVGVAVHSSPNNVELWVTSQSEHGLTRISIGRILPTVDATQLVTEPFGHSVGLLEDDDGVDQVWYAGAFANSVFSYSPASGGDPVSIYDEPSLNMKSLRAHRVGSGNEVLLLRAPADCGTPGTKGVYRLALGIAPVSENGLLNCPETLAIAPGAGPLTLYVLDFDDVGTQRVIRIRESEEDPVQELVAELPVGSAGYGLAVSPVTVVPEPNAAALAAIALVALILRRRA